MVMLSGVVPHYKYLMRCVDVTGAVQRLFNVAKCNKAGVEILWFL